MLLVEVDFHSFLRARFLRLHQSGPEKISGGRRVTSMKRLIVGTAILLAFAALPASAQNVEITPFIGYAFDGNFSDAYYYYDSNSPLENYELNESSTYGIDVQFRTSPQSLFGVQYSHQATELRPQNDGIFEPNAPGTPMDVDYLHLVGTWEPAKRGLVPFLSAGLGAAKLSPEGNYSDATRFSWVFGGGVKAPISQNVALRLQGRLLSTYIEEGHGDVCDPHFCYGTDASTFLYQFEASAGLTIKF